MSTGLIDSINRRTQLAGYNRLALLLFRLGGPELFGINVFKVQEVVQAPKLTWVPAAHSPQPAGVAAVPGVGYLRATRMGASSRRRPKRCALSRIRHSSNVRLIVVWIRTRSMVGQVARSPSST